MHTIQHLQISCTPTIYHTQREYFCYEALRTYKQAGHHLTLLSTFTRTFLSRIWYHIDIWIR